MPYKKKEDKKRYNKNYYREIIKKDEERYEEHIRLSKKYQEENKESSYKASKEAMKKRRATDKEYNKKEAERKIVKYQQCKESREEIKDIPTKFIMNSMGMSKYYQFYFHEFTSVEINKIKEDWGNAN